jgi:hypothetical protein
MGEILFSLVGKPDFNSNFTVYDFSCTIVSPSCFLFSLFLLVLQSIKVIIYVFTRFVAVCIDEDQARDHCLF